MSQPPEPNDKIKKVHEGMGPERFPFEKEVDTMKVIDYNPKA